MNDDPIVAAIAHHQRIYKAWLKVGNPDEGQISDLYDDASQRLFETAPSTIKGVIALLNYVIKGKHDCSERWGYRGVDFAGPILRSIRKGLTTTKRRKAQNVIKRHKAAKK